MLDDYKEGQVVVYNILLNAINNQKVAHAYLISSDNAEISNNFALSFAKSLICPGNKTKQSGCENCSLCFRIENNNFPELKRIEPDGLWIKKEQLLELQKEFGMKALEGNKKVYIINQVERLNNQAANSILKFLEEPEPNIIALLTTSDIHNVLPTIVSRCQLLNLNNNHQNKAKLAEFDNVSNKTLLKIGNIFYSDEKELHNYVNNEDNVKKIEAIIYYIKKYEALGLDVLTESKKSWNDYFKDKEDYIWAFDIMALFYKDVLNLVYNKELELFDYYKDVLEFVLSKNDIDDILYKLQKILLAKEKIKYNVNLNLLMDKLILEIESR